MILLRSGVSSSLLSSRCCQQKMKKKTKVSNCELLQTVFVTHVYSRTRREWQILPSCNRRTFQLYIWVKNFFKPSIYVHYFNHGLNKCTYIWQTWYIDGNVKKLCCSSIISGGSLVYKGLHMSQIKSSDITDSVSQKSHISWIILSGCSLSVIVIIVLIVLIVIIIILVIVSQWVGVLGVVWCVSGSRGWRVGFFNFGSDRVRVLEKVIGSGLGLGSGICIIYWINRVLKFLIGSFPILSYLTLGVLG